MSNPDFVALIHSLIDSAMAAMGEHNALAARLERDGVKNIEVATRSLKLLEALSQKTRGNLSLDESEILVRGLTRIRTGLERLNAPTKNEVR